MSQATDDIITSPCKTLQACVVIDASAQFETRRALRDPLQGWTVEQIRSTHAPTVKSLPFVQRKGESDFGRPLSWWNDAPGFDHKADFSRGKAYATLAVEAMKLDRCDSHPLEQIFKSIVDDAVARKIKGGKHSRTLPPAIDGFLWQLSRELGSALDFSRVPPA